MENIGEVIRFFFAECNYSTQQFGLKIEYDVKKITNELQRKGLFKTLYTYSNVHKVASLSAEFDFFLDAPQTNAKYYIFGTNHSGFDYAVNKKTGKVAILEEITGAFLLDVAENEVAFMQAFTKVIEFGNLYKKKVKVDGDLTRKIRREAIELAGGDQYAKIYKNIIISEEDMPMEPFTLP